jgi:hypothetical protein
VILWNWREPEPANGQWLYALGVGSPPRQGARPRVRGDGICALEAWAAAPVSAHGGSDYSGWRPPSPEWLRGQGFTFVCRYLDWLPNEKVLSLDEFQGLRASGIGVVLNWEDTAERVLGGYAAGQQDGTEARRQAGMLGAWPTVIYFSADFDVTASQQPALNAYLQGAATALGGSEFIGVYGGYWAVKRALDAEVCAFAWQTYAWSNGMWDARAQLRQVPGGNDDYDLDQAMVTEFGQVGAVPITISQLLGGSGMGLVGMTFRPGGTGTPASPQGFRLDVAYIEAGSNHLLHGWNNQGTSGQFGQEDLGGGCDPRFGASCVWSPDGDVLVFQVVGTDGHVWTYQLNGGLSGNPRGPWVQQQCQGQPLSPAAP